MSDKFHEIYPDADEPKLPVRIYNQLLDRTNERLAFDILTKYEDGDITIDEIKSKYNIE